MKLSLLKWIFIVLIGSSCNQGSVDKFTDNYSDTISIVTTSYVFGDENFLKHSEYTLVKASFVSELNVHKYFQDGMERMVYTFNPITPKAVARHVPNDYTLIDSLVTQLHGNTEKLFKYEIENYAIDGGGCIVLSKNYGLVASASYTWNGVTLLRKFNGLLLEPELKKLLLIDSVGFLKSNKQYQTVTVPKITR